jgi:NAD(P)-dependent dehydrogenase (short-subunit alcohol dehydrogenase family)
MSDGRMQGRTVIVTGAGTAKGVGNGQAIATTLARHGASVLCVDRVQERAQAVADLITADGGTATAHAADVTDMAATEGMAEAALSAYGRIDGLVNVVGVVSRGGLQRRVAGGALGEFENPDIEDWDNVLRTNVTSAMLCTRAVYPAMKAQGGGSVVCIGSTMGSLFYGEGSLAYGTAKAALEGLVLNAAGALGPFNIRVNLLVIGQVRAPHIEAGAEALGPELGGRMLERRRLSGLLETDGTPWDVANTAMFLLSDESRWITAQELFVDAGAGRTLREPPARA